jgi:hypothetical protein
VAVYLVCEGSLSGLDRRVLGDLVIQHHNLPVLIEPAGGGRGPGAVRTYLENRSPNNVAVAIEDRDFRSGAVANATWANPGGKSFIWRRHEIENYLVHPRVMLGLFDDFRAAGAAWTNQLPGTAPAVSTFLQSLAQPLLEDHAAQVVRTELLQLVNAAGSLSFGPQPPAPPAGAHVCGSAQWLPALHQEALRLCQTCSAVAVLPDLQPAAITTRYNARLAQVQNPNFLNSGDYLIDLAGKDLLAALSRHLVGLGAPAAYTKTALADELLRILQPVYQPNTIYQPDDFAELANILAQY